MPSGTTEGPAGASSDAEREAFRAFQEGTLTHLAPAWDALEEVAVEIEAFFAANPP